MRDAGEDLYRSWDRPGWADEGLKLAFDAASTHFHGSDLGDLGALASTGSLKVDDAEGDFGQGSSQVVERRTDGALINNPPYFKQTLSTYANTKYVCGTEQGRGT